MTDLAQQLREALQQYFQYDDFLDGQHHAVETISQGNDLCVIMPTGAGKSICYQLPALLRDGYTIVVSPLIALMKDQVDALRAKNIPALYLNSTLSPAEQARNTQMVIDGQCKLLYIAPERFRAGSFRQLLKNNPPACLVVDEAHCISQWGHDFRPDYKRIGEYCKEVGIKQICAFTATATPEVREDILRQLHRPEMECHVTGFTRPNLKFSVIEASGKDKKLKVLKGYIAEKKPTIIYCSSRKNVDEVANTLGVVAYHAGLSDKERDSAQHYFLTDECPVLVATNAFGMGIDRGDIRRVVHYNFPGSLEAYYQEAGRAGRDGEESDCVMFFSYADRHIHEFLIDLNNPSKVIIEGTWEALLRLDRLYEHQALEVKLADLADEVPGSKEQQLSGVLKTLEDGGYIERKFSNQNLGRLRLTGDIQQIFNEHSQIRTQRSIFITKAIVAYQQSLAYGIEASYYDLERMSGLNGDQVKRVLRALRDAQVIDWRPPFSGRPIQLIRHDEELQMDFSGLEEKRAIDMARLDHVVSYSKARKCRQMTMIRYFGQEEEWRCQICDLCTGSVQKQDQEILQDKKLVLKCLKAVDHHDGRIGRSKLGQLLTGSKSKAIVDSYLDRSPFYNELYGYKISRVYEALDLLEQQGFCKKSNGKYPVMQITGKGERTIADLEGTDRRSPMESKSGPMFGSAKKEEKSGPLFGSPKKETKSGPMFGSPKKATAQEAQPSLLDSYDESSLTENEENLDLYEKLRTLRNIIAKNEDLQPFQVFNNETIKQLSKAAPVAIAELTSIKGIGPAKIDKWGILVLEVIKMWRKEQL